MSELLYQAARFFGDVFGDDVAGANYLERALGVDPLHDAAFAALAEQLVRRDEKRRLAELYAHAAMHRPDPNDRLAMLRDAAAMLDALPRRARTGHRRVLADRPALSRGRGRARTPSSRCSCRPTGTATSLGCWSTRSRATSATRTRSPSACAWVDLYSQQLHEPDHVLPHLEQILAIHPEHEDARRIAVRLLAVKGLAARRAPSALAMAFDATGQPDEVAKFLTIELEHSRGAAALRAALSVSPI